MKKMSVLMLNTELSYKKNYLKFICSEILSLKLVLKTNWFKFSAGFDFLFSEWGIFAAFTLPEYRIDIKFFF